MGKETMMRASESRFWQRAFASAHFLLAFVLIAGYLLKIEISSLVIASLACAGGATMAGAISSSKGWDHLITPGILVGMFGNAVGTFIGIAVWQFYL